MELTDIKNSTWDSIRKGMYMVANEPRGSFMNFMAILE